MGEVVYVLSGYCTWFSDTIVLGVFYSVGSAEEYMEKIIQKANESSEREHYDYYCYSIEPFLVGDPGYAIDEPARKYDSDGCEYVE